MYVSSVWWSLSHKSVVANVLTLCKAFCANVSCFCAEMFLTVRTRSTFNVLGWDWTAGQYQSDSKFSVLFVLVYRRLVFLLLFVSYSFTVNPDRRHSCNKSNSSAKGRNLIQNSELSQMFFWLWHKVLSSITIRKFSHNLNLSTVLNAEKTHATRRLLWNSS